MLVSCQIVPDADREASWHADADRITGEVARHLATARARLSPSFDPSAHSAPLTTPALPERRRQFAVSRIAT